MKFILAMLIIFPAFVFAADPCGITGLYDLSGWEPGDNFSKAPTYTGGIKITEYGGTYRFEGSADAMIFFGKGITRDCKTFAFVFSSADKSQTGVTMLFKDGSDFQAMWIYNLPDTSAAGKEIWRKK